MHLCILIHSVYQTAYKSPRSRFHYTLSIVYCIFFLLQSSLQHCEPARRELAGWTNMVPGTLDTSTAYNVLSQQSLFIFVYTVHAWKSTYLLHFVNTFIFQSSYGILLYASLQNSFAYLFTRFMQTASHKYLQGSNSFQRPNHTIIQATFVCVLFPISSSLTDLRQTCWVYVGGPPICPWGVLFRKGQQVDGSTGHFHFPLYYICASLTPHSCKRTFCFAAAAAESNLAPFAALHLDG